MIWNKESLQLCWITSGTLCSDEMNIAVWCADAAAHLITISAVWVLVFSMYLRKPMLILCILWRKFHSLCNSDDFFCVEVPADVFAPDFLWKGSYNYKGQKEPLTLTVSCFNTTSGQVNATVADSSVEFLLSGETSINHLSPRSLRASYPSVIYQITSRTRV